MLEKINDFLIRNKEYSVAAIRIGLALVFLWFGIDEVFNPENWFGYVPQWISSILPLSLKAFIILNGIFEIIIGIFLLIGFYTRFFALITSIHLLLIIMAVGYNEIGVRDFGLVAMAISLVFSGSGVLSLDNKISKTAEFK